MSNFRERVCELVSQIPRGKVMTYGQIAAMCGNPRAARIVGGIAHFGNPELPWQRVVKKDGSLAEGYPGGIAGHQSVLEKEGVEFISGRVDMRRATWRPS
jgi:methylated-DNA-protein-cysteine methyltransferase related protein